MLYLIDKKIFIVVTLYSTQTPLDAFEMNFFLNIMKNETFAPEEQCLIFHNIFKTIEM